MRLLRLTAMFLLALTGYIIAAVSISAAANPASQTSLKSPSSPRGGWYCLIWEKVNGNWVCRLQEKRL